MGPHNAFDQERRALLARLRRLTPYQDDVEDAIQDAVLAVLCRARLASTGKLAQNATKNKICQTDADDHILRDQGLLYLIAKRRIIDIIRHRCRWAGCSLEMVDCYKYDNSLEASFIEDVTTREAFAKLPEVDQRLLLFHSQGLDCGEIAAALTVSKESIKKRLQRARQRFESALYSSG